MDWLMLLAVAVALGTDAFSLALGMGLTGSKRRIIILFPLIVALFHVLMPLSGMLAGRLFGGMLGKIARIFGGVILVAIGGRTLYQAFCIPGQSFSFAQAQSVLRGEKSAAGQSLPALLFLALGVSVDALSVGFSLGALGAQVMGAVIVMGVVAGGMTWAGLVLGNVLGEWIGQRAEIAGGLILLLIGLKIMV